MKIFYVYKITNLINGKNYIGMTQNLDKRFKAHKSISKNTNGDKFYIHNSILKYGVENFSFEPILECVSFKEALKAEIILIEQYKSFEKGYNLTKGGEGVLGRKVSKEEREAASKRTSVRNIGNQYWLGKTHTEEHKIYMSNIIKEKISSGEIKRRTGFFKINEEQQLSLINDYKSGMMKSELMIKYNVGKSLISRLFKLYNIKGNPGNHSAEGKERIRTGSLKRTEENDIKIRDLYSTGLYTYKQLGEIFNLSKNTIDRIITGRKT